ncbi:uncharacterized protein RCC_04289 [Ramularia collo-cygni]|uniref:Uncharacterized protein n=1 Tax=Ramularia collo-cygni TaxID=112498 RepID=A0A2D3V7B6_9PEZI|nr:uncharacterized protein RCC_04289 [Ramularia collo-cygni]CZT18444.1 uncharacterized protein RCC_04289 [Ramularia collo-cygni]
MKTWNWSWLRSTTYYLILNPTEKVLLLEETPPAGPLFVEVSNTCPQSISSTRMGAGLAARRCEFDIPKENHPEIKMLPQSQAAVELMMFKLLYGVEIFTNERDTIHRLCRNRHIRSPV